MKSSISCMFQAMQWSSCHVVLLCEAKQSYTVQRGHAKFFKQWKHSFSVACYCVSIFPSVRLCSVHVTRVLSHRSGLPNLPACLNYFKKLKSWGVEPKSLRWMSYVLTTRSANMALFEVCFKLT